MRAIIKLPKPRNPLVAPARNRKAGAHGSYNPERRARRVEKYKLYLLLSGRKTEEDYDA
jgi:hypothetical protein